MTITYPRALVDNAAMAECWFDLAEPVVMQASAKGQLINLSQVNDPVWRGTFQTGILERDKQSIWSAWRKSLRGTKTFVAYDVRKSTPRAYPNATSAASISGAWDGMAVVSSVGLSGALGLTGLPASYQFKIGDRVGLEQSGKYGYYEILEDVTASGGGAATINVAPFLHTTLFNTSAVCRVWRPVCQFLIDQATWAEQGTVEKTPIAFNGVQRL